jgi:hypothetical protein
MNFQDKPNIKDQIDILNSEINDILSADDALNPDALLNFANTVKDVITVPANEIAEVNNKLTNSPIETNADVLKEAVNSVTDLKMLLQSCNGILNTVYSQIASLDISDARMIEATAAFVNAMKDTIQSFIDLYRDEQNFLHNIILKKIDFEHKKQIIKFKHELEYKAKPYTDVSSGKLVAYSQEELMKAINEASISEGEIINYHNL